MTSEETIKRFHKIITNSIYGQFGYVPRNIRRSRIISKIFDI